MPVTEVEALAWMAAWAAKGKAFSGADAWRRAKVEALNAMGPRSILDIGVGDMRHLIAWGGVLGGIPYLGVDGCAELIELRQREHPTLRFEHRRASQLVEESRPGYHAVLCWDVLYHLPDRDLHDRLYRWLFEQGSEFVAVSWALPTAPPASPEGMWFPHPWPGPPAGWEPIFGDEEKTTPHHQRMEVYQCSPSSR